ncbi:MAG TPA: glycosyl hydrolase family 18 protein [Lacipirellulaceae bacterium]|nr:glycosyl hydrolase family 18 protein [Lacipirellulaceae bacterium]
MRVLIRVILLYPVVFLLLGECRVSAVDLIGYVPSYRMSQSYEDNILPTQLSMLNEVRYFGLTAASNGTIVPQSGTGSLQQNLDRITLIQHIINTLPPAQRPRLDITIGGAGQDATFTNIASTVKGVPCNLCSTFAQNVKSLLDTTGATSVDIDWENPDAGVERTTSYPDMLTRIKTAIGANRRVYAVVDPTVIISNSVFNGPNAIDGVSLMTYDLGWWGNDPENAYQGEHSLPVYVTNSVDAWTEPAGSHNDRNWVFGSWGNNVPAADIGVGLPFYAHTVTGADATATYSDLVSGGTLLPPDPSRPGPGDYYSYQGQTYWLPGPALAAQRVQFAHDRGLQDVFIWELGQDLDPTNPNSLLRTAFLKNETLMGDFDGDHEMNDADYDIWRSTFGSTTDLRADANGNGVVDLADYLIWREHAASPGSGVSVGSQVPEPATMCSLVLGSFVVLGIRRMR